MNDMQPSDIKTFLIRRSYFMCGTPVVIAKTMNQMFADQIGRTSPDDIEHEWQEQARSNPLYCQARPANGFEQTRELALVGRMAAA